MRSPVPFGNGSSVVGTRNLSFSKSMCGFGVRKMEARRNLAVLEHQHRLEQTGDARCGFQMAEIGFYRANRQRRVGGSIAAESFRKRMRFDRIAHRRAGAVGFDKADLLRRNSCIPAGVLHQSRLRLRAGQRDAVGVSVLIDRRPQDHALDRIAIRDRSARVA